MINHDPANYTALLVPFDSEKAANESAISFFEKLTLLRQEHNLPDVHVIIIMRYTSDSGAEDVGITSAHFGNSAEILQMCAWSFSKEQERLHKIMVPPPIDDNS